MNNGFSIEEAKLKCLNKMPFLGSILYALPVEEVEKEKLSTLGVDGETLFVNMEFWNKHSKKEQMALLMHEAGHLFLKHIWRGRNYTGMAIDPSTGQQISIFNLAGDYVINLMINEDSRFSLPKGCLLDKKYEGWATEEVYMDLLKNMPKMSKEDLQKMIDSGICDKSMWGKSQGKQAKELEKKWDERIKQAAEYAKAQGKEPAWLKRVYEDLTPKEDWRNLLREYAMPWQGDYTFTPVDRRYLEADFLLPEIQDGEQLNWIAIAIDTSSSIGDKELSAFMSELRGILGAYDKVKVRLTFCDADASPFVELEEFDASKIKVSGGGGTDFNPVFNLIKKEETEPKVLCYFTDTQGTFPAKAPNYDVMWIAIEDGKVPWGKLLKYKV